MPTVCLIANVGQRDLQIDGKPLPPERMRTRATEIEAAFEQHVATMNAPMLAAALERVRRDANLERIDALVLVATDQRDEHFRNGDTEPAAQVLKHFVGRAGRQAPGTIIVVPIADPPNSYDRMLDVYRREILPRKQVKNVDKVYVLCTGGTPACNTALLIASVELYRERVTALYVSEKTGVCTPLNVGAVLLDAYRKAAREHALRHHDFASIANDAANPQLARDVARAACARANFDFDTVDSVLADRYSDLEPLDAAVIDRLLSDAQHLRDGVPAYLLRDLYWNAWMRWHREEFADFLGRVWRILEMAYQTLLREATGIELDGSPRADRALLKWVNERPWLQDVLSKQRIEPRQNMVAMEAILKSLASREGACSPDLRERIDSVLPPAIALQGARDLRNKSVIAHGFRGLSQCVVLETLGLDESGLWQKIESVLAALSVEAGEDPYDQFAALLRKADP